MWVLQKSWLNWSRCRLGCGLGWALATMYLMGVQIPTRRGNLEGEKGLTSTWPAVSLLEVTQQGAAPVQCKFQLECAIWGAHWRHLVNVTEPFVCGGDAALWVSGYSGQIYLRTFKDKLGGQVKNSKNLTRGKPAYAAALKCYQKTLHASKLIFSTLHVGKDQSSNVGEHNVKKCLFYFKILEHYQKYAKWPFSTHRYTNKNTVINKYLHSMQRNYEF